MRLMRDIVVIVVAVAGLLYTFKTYIHSNIHSFIQTYIQTHSNTPVLESLSFM